MNLILCDDDKVFLNKLEIRIRGLSQKHKIAVKMECLHIPQELRIRSRGTERHSASN